MGDVDGVLGLMGAAGVLDASPGPLGPGGGSMMREKRSEGKFWANMT